MLQQKGRFILFFNKFSTKNTKMPCHLNPLDRKTSILMPASSFKDQFEATCLGKKPLDFENNRWYIRSSIAIKVDIYIVKLGVVQQLLLDQLWLLVSICSHRFRYIPSNMVNVDGVLNEHAMFLVLVNRFENRYQMGQNC